MIGDARYARLRGSKPGWRVYGNPPACVAAQVGEEPDCVESLVYSSDGGNMPQALVNSVCDQSESCTRARGVGGGNSLSYVGAHFSSTDNRSLQGRDPLWRRRRV